MGEAVLAYNVAAGEEVNPLCCSVGVIFVGPLGEFFAPNAVVVSVAEEGHGKWYINSYLPISELRLLCRVDYIVLLDIQSYAQGRTKREKEDKWLG